MDLHGDFTRSLSVGPTGNWVLLIDGENVSSAHAPEVLAVHPEAFAVRRVYGNLKALGGWQLQPELKVVHTEAGNNSADILLAVEAVVLQQEGAREFVIVSGDGGMIHVIRHLREKGCRVVVMASENSTSALRAAGQHFVPLKAPTPSPPKPADSKKTVSTSTLVPPKKIQKQLEDFLLDALKKAGEEGTLISKLNHLVAAETGVRISTLPEKNWRAYLTAPARNGLYICDPRGPTARVRLATGALRA